MLKALKSLGHKHMLRRAIGDYDVPSFPALAMRALEIARSPDASAADVAAVLTRDPGLSVRLLGAVNSSAYALRRKVDSLPQAVAMLGMSNVESIVAAIAVGSAFKKVDAPNFDMSSFWQAAARRAATSQSLNQRISPKARAEGFTAALLQDMAVPLLAASRPKQYGPVRDAWLAGHGSLVDLECDAFGFDHSAVGGWLCEEWQLPASLRESIRAHHEPPGTVAGVPPCVSIVSALREGSEDGVDAIFSLAEKICGLPRAEMEELLEASFARASELALLFGA